MNDEEKPFAQIVAEVALGILVLLTLGLIGAEIFHPVGLYRWWYVFLPLGMPFGIVFLAGLSYGIGAALNSVGGNYAKRKTNKHEQGEDDG